MRKGVLVELMPAFGVSMPNVIAFQFNPETLRHSWTQPQPTTSGSHPLAVPGLPGETFSFTLAMDATDQLSLPKDDPLGIDSRRNGIYARLAALEMLMFPAKASSGLSGTSPQAKRPRAVPAAQLPTALFRWGDVRFVPVRVTSLTVTEKLFDASLNPTHAEAQIELRVLTPDELASAGPLKNIMVGAYNYSQYMREAFALANLYTAAGSSSLATIPGS